jgi:4a-hydroxytetrahydrobiopterin dehydratase
MMEGMTTLNRAELSAAVGDDGWRLILGDLCTQAVTGSLRQGTEAAAALAGVELAAVEQAAGQTGADLRLDARQDRLLVTLANAFRDGGADPAAVANARRLTARLRELGLTPEPARSQTAEIAIDALDIPAVLPFWRAVLGYVDESDVAIIDPAGKGPSFWFQQMDAPRPQRNRIHIDVVVPHDQARPRIEAALAAGGRIAGDEEAPAFWVLADREGNEACVCTWQARD